MDTKTLKRNQQFVIKIIAIAIASVILISTILTIFSGKRISNIYKNLIMEELKATCEHLDNEVSALNDDGDWSMDGDILLKGGEPIGDEIEGIIDGLNKETGIDYTIFYGDTRILTTIYKNGTTERLVGTKASDAVIKDVLGNGNEWNSTDLVIEGMPYFGYYCPLINSDDSIVGMVFCGRKSQDVTQNITRAIISMIAIVLVLLSVIASVSIIFAKRVSKIMKKIASELGRLSEGNLDLEIEEKALIRKDELGLIADSSKELSQKLTDIISTTKEMVDSVNKAGNDLSESAEQASQASEQVAEAIDGISKGAVSQAESVTDASCNTENIGQDIEIIGQNVGQLDEYSLKMKQSCDGAMKSIESLVEQNSDVQMSVSAIGETINSTNASASEISDFSKAISDIASQTNLLALNASIEAARAGEAGKGFAVVADNIKGLAGQSSDSASKIKEVVDKLVADAESSVEVLSNLNTQSPLHFSLV